MPCKKRQESMPPLFSLLYQSLSLCFLHTPPPGKETARKSSCMHVCSLAKLCLTLCDPVDWSLPDFSVHGILQARILEWVAIPPPGDHPNPGIEPASPALAADSLPLSHQGNPTRKQTSINPEDAFPRTQPHWHLDPGHSSFQSCER